MLIWYVLSVYLVLVMGCELYTLRTGVPTVATFPSARNKIIEILASESRGLPSPVTILDLGSGSGQLTWRIARAFPEARVTGVELSLVPWARSVIRRWLLGPSNLRYVREDFWAFDCAPFDVVVLFLTENIIAHVGDKLRKELKPGALVIANDTALRGDWNAVEVHDTGLMNMKVYVYRQEKQSDISAGGVGHEV